ncbi:hypothetical protein B0H11DRAFT_1910213 [Mycena galericulata]|nr:hypothetical protein B0H11DRAFT_1910213 [Mycena galericulata]
MQRIIPSDRGLSQLTFAQTQWDNMTTYKAPTGSIDDETYGHLSLVPYPLDQDGQPIAPERLESHAKTHDFELPSCFHGLTVKLTNALVDLTALIAYPEYVEFQKYRPRIYNPPATDRKSQGLTVDHSHDKSEVGAHQHRTTDGFPGPDTTTMPEIPEHAILSRRNDQTLQGTVNTSMSIAEAAPPGHDPLRAPRLLPLLLQPEDPLSIEMANGNRLVPDGTSDRSESIGSHDSMSVYQSSCASDESYQDSSENDRDSTTSEQSSCDSMPELESVTGTSISVDSPAEPIDSHYIGLLKGTATLRRITDDLSRKVRKWIESHPELAEQTKELLKELDDLHEVTMTSVSDSPTTTPELGKGDLCDPPCPICIYARDDPGHAAVNTEEVD